jgi:hypothetical protein
MSQHTPKSWTVEHKPGWKTSSGMACDTGCNITAHDGQTTVTLCPLHAAAPDLLAALQRAADTFRDFEAANRALRRDTMADAAEIAARDARAAIRAATGG